MGVLRYKIWYDLWKNKSRTLQVVLIVGMGAFAVGMIIALVTDPPAPPTPKTGATVSARTTEWHSTQD